MLAPRLPPETNAPLFPVDPKGFPKRLGALSGRVPKFGKAQGGAGGESPRFPPVLPNCLKIGAHPLVLLMMGRHRLSHGQQETDQVTPIGLAFHPYTATSVFRQ